MKIEQLIKDYNKAENKELAIKEIAREAKITRNGVVKFLRQYGIQIPKGVVIVEEWEEEGYVEEERGSIISEEEEEKDIISSMAIEQYWSERWDNKEEVEKAMLMHTYLLNKLSLNSFGIYIASMEYIIKKGTQRGLTEHLDKIMVGIPFKAKTRETHFADIILKSVEKMLIELNEPETEAEPKEVIDEKPLLVRIYEAYRMLENPMKYKVEQWRERKAIKEKEFMKEGMEVLREVLDNG